MSSNSTYKTAVQPTMVNIIDAVEALDSRVAAEENAACRIRIQLLQDVHGELTGNCSLLVYALDASEEANPADNRYRELESTLETYSSIAVNSLPENILHKLAVLYAVPDVCDEGATVRTPPNVDGVGRKINHVIYWVDCTLEDVMQLQKHRGVYK